MAPEPRGLVISVMLAVTDAPAAVAWYKRALGATELWSLGSVAGLEIAGAAFFVGEPAANGWESPQVLGITTTRVEVFCEDPDAFIARAVKEGAAGDRDRIRDHEAPWGIHRQGGFVDPFGHIWLVGDKSPLRRMSSPRSKFHFTVAIAGVGTTLQFQEVSGLDVEAHPIEYRAGTSRDFAATKLSALRKSTNITLKRGVFQKDKALLEWIAGGTRGTRGTPNRSTVTITLLDESGRPAMTWRLSNARPAKIAAPELNAAGNDVAVETLELAHDGLTIDTT